MVLVSAVIIIGFFAVYTVTKQSMEQQSEIIMHGIAKDEGIVLNRGLDSINTENPAIRILGNTFFVKVSKNGDVIEYSKNSAYDQKVIENAAAQALKDSKLKGFLKSGSQLFKYIKVEKEYGNILVFINTSAENYFLNKMLFTSAIITLISSVLVFFISLYLSNKAIKPIRDSWDKQNVFVADASHELRTPLTVVNSNLEIVMGNNEETVESQNKWLGNIEREIKRMSKLVEDLLFLARADMHEEEMAMDMFNISNSITQTIETFKPLLDKKSINIKSDIYPDVIVKGSEGRIKQLLNILVDNAMNHTQAGGGIELGLVKYENFYEIIVSDKGDGIPKEEIDKIFERFYRVDKSRSRNYGGSGLGLSIAQCIVKEHNGSIFVNSEVRKGTEFRVRMPM